MDWTDPWRDAFRIELRAEAINFAEHGWPVVPGSYPRGDHWVGAPYGQRAGTGAHGFVPVHRNWRVVVFSALPRCGQVSPLACCWPPGWASTRWRFLPRWDARARSGCG